MNVDEFWELIDESNEKGREDKQIQIEFIRSSLMEMEAQHIFDFEELLRLKIIGNYSA